MPFIDQPLRNPSLSLTISMAYWPKAGKTSIALKRYAPYFLLSRSRHINEVKPQQQCSFLSFKPAQQQALEQKQSQSAPRICMT